MRTKRAVLVKFSIVLLKACWASLVKASASSSIANLYGTLPIAFIREKSFILCLTTSIPLSSDALVSKTLAFQFLPYKSLAIAKAQVVFPVPAGPANRQWGMFLFFTKAFRRSTTCFWLITSFKDLGLYFSAHTSNLIIQSLLIF